MEMFLMALALSLLGVTVSAVLFAAATRQNDEPEAAVERAVLVQPRFFGDQESGVTRVPAEALLLEIERHVRLEQAAAESFLHAPTAESLHSPTVSRLVH